MWRKIYLVLFWIGVLVLTPLTYLWVKKHGVWGGVDLWLRSWAMDPIFATAEFDFILLMLSLGGWMIWDGLPRIPASRYKVLLVLGWALVYTNTPSLGFLIYILWIKNRPSAIDRSGPFLRK